MVPGTKIERSPAPDVDSSTVWGSWGAEADELSEPLEVEVPEDISNEDPKNLEEIRQNKRRKVCGEPNQRRVTGERWRKRGTQMARRGTKFRD